MNDRFVIFNVQHNVVKKTLHMLIYSFMKASDDNGNEWRTDVIFLI